MRYRGRRVRCANRGGIVVGCRRPRALCGPRWRAHRGPRRRVGRRPSRAPRPCRRRWRRSGHLVSQVQEVDRTRPPSPRAERGRIPSPGLPKYAEPRVLVGDLAGARTRLVGATGRVEQDLVLLVLRLAARRAPEARPVGPPRRGRGRRRIPRAGRRGTFPPLIREVLSLPTTRTSS